LILALLPAAEPAKPVDADAIDTLVQKAMQAWRVPGVAVGIVRDGEVIYLKGHGLRSLKGTDPVTPDTVFPLASCSKAFTTAVLAQLVAEGKLDWDDPVRKHLPDFHLADPLADRDVTLRDLLCHRTGVASNDWLWYYTDLPAEERIKRVGMIPLERPFRTAFQYQSTMFTAAGLSAGRAAKKSWSDLVQARLLEPLGMKRTVLTSTDAQNLEPAGGHQVNGMGKIEPLPPFFMTKPDPAGSVHSCARDLCRWLNYQLTTPLLDETHRPQMVIPMDDMTRKNHPDTVQLSYGMAWVVQDYHGQSLRSHAGLIDGFRVHLALVPRARLGIVLLNNLDRTQMNQSLLNSLLDHLLGLPRRDWNRYHLDLKVADDRRVAKEEREREAKIRHDTQPSLPLRDYVGTYSHKAAGEIEIASDGKTLRFSWQRLHGNLEHSQFDTFSGLDLRGKEILFTFEIDKATGQPNGLSVPDIVKQPFRRK
jgi:CubicO group peptidase (beta-lactamase class C family)